MGLWRQLLLSSTQCLSLLNSSKGYAQKKIPPLHPLIIIHLPTSFCRIVFVQCATCWHDICDILNVLHSIYKKYVPSYSILGDFMCLSGLSKNQASISLNITFFGKYMNGNIYFQYCPWILQVNATWQLTSQYKTHSLFSNSTPLCTENLTGVEFSRLYPPSWHDITDLSCKDGILPSQYPPVKWLLSHCHHCQSCDIHFQIYVVHKDPTSRCLYNGSTIPQWNFQEPKSMTPCNYCHSDHSKYPPSHVCCRRYFGTLVPPSIYNEGPSWYCWTDLSSHSTWGGRGWTYIVLSVISKTTLHSWWRLSLSL